MRAFALTCEALAHLDSVEGKRQCAAAYLTARSSRDIAVAARFLSGTPLPPGTPAACVGSATIAALIAERCGIAAETLRRRAVSKGDLGTAVAQSLEGVNEGSGNLTLLETANLLLELGKLTAGGRNRRLGKLFARLDPLEAKYVTKLLVGNLRTGMQAGRVEDALSLAFRRPVAAVRHAHMLLGDIGLVAERSLAGTLGNVRLRAFRPVRCMLSHTANDPAEVSDSLEAPVFAEPKHDGVRAQLHARGNRYRIYSRGLEDMTHLFPEIGDGLSRHDDDWIFDGEILAWKDGPLGFSPLQQRLGRRQVPLMMLLDVPVVFWAFDVLRASGRDLIGEPLRERKRFLSSLPLAGPVRELPSEELADLAMVSAWFEDAVERGCEGAVFKDAGSLYRPGTRGRSWLTLKKPLGRLDVVVTAAQYGRGKRAGWLSDLTFAVRDGEGLVEIGKAYSGLTDSEIIELTEIFKETTIDREADAHRVEPAVVLEVAFGGVQRSRRHESGFALRFPRIVRWRNELAVADIDGLERVRELYAAQGVPADS